MPSCDVAALYELDGAGDDELSYDHPIQKRVYGTLERGGAGWFERVRTGYDLLTCDGGRERFYVPLREDHVSILWVGGVAVRQVWIGYVKSLEIPDLVRAIPEVARIVDALRDDVDLDLCVRSVRTLADWSSQVVEVLSVAAFFDRAAKFGLKAVVGGKPFWVWAEIFVEALPHLDIMRFRRHDPDPRRDVLDHPHSRPGD